MKAKIIKELKDFKGKACLIELNKKFYVVSSISNAFDTGMPETLIFRSDKNGKVTDYSEVAGGRNKTRKQAITQLEEQL